jgi:hypothetical protein
VEIGSEEKMNITEETLNAIHARLQALSENATPEQVAYLGKAFEIIASRGRMIDIELLASEKISELQAQTAASIGSCEGEKNAHVAEIGTAGESAVAAVAAAINSANQTLNALIDERKPELENLIAPFESVNDVPVGSSIMNEIFLEGERRKFIRNGALPFVFGVLSRYNDYSYGVGGFSTELGTFGTPTTVDIMLQLLTGSHSQETNYSGFYREPTLCFLQGAQGNFIQREFYSKYAADVSQYAYPYATLGVFFIKNTTGNPITTALNFGGSAHAVNSEFSSLWIGTPDSQNAAVSWTAAYSCIISTGEFAGVASFTIPANTTVAVMLFTNAYYYTSTTYTNAQFLHWYVHSFRSATLVEGLEIDVEKTLKAWQCKGIACTYELWS